MNHFIGVVPKGLAEHRGLQQLLGKLKRTVGDWGDPVRWMPPELWHVTLVFLGDRTPEESGRIIHLLDSWVPPAPVHLSLHGLGAFPRSDAGRVLWIGVRKTQAFLELQGSLEANLIDAGLATRAEQDFQPHLTLVRFRHVRHLQELTSLGGKMDLGEYPIEELILFESVIQGQIPKYIPRFVKKL